MTTEGMHVSLAHPHPRTTVLLTAAAAPAVPDPLMSAPTGIGRHTLGGRGLPAPAQTIDNIGASGAWWVRDLEGFDPKVPARSVTTYSCDGGSNQAWFRR